MEKNILEIKNLWVSFKQRRKPVLQIIRGVDIEIPKGKIIGLVGESGSGKSVTSKTFLGVNNNAITYFEKYKIANFEFEDYKSINWKSIRGPIISYIPQNPMTSMNPSRKIKDHIFDVLNSISKKELNKNFSTWKKQTKTKSKSLKDFYYFKTIDILEKFRINNPQAILNYYPHQLSGGMKQRIIIAMSVLSGAKIIVADEPTTALDVTVQSSILNLLQEINEKLKISIIFISHDISVVAKLCDYIYVMYAGKVLEKASTETLFTNPKHPYTWALMASIPEGKSKDKKLFSIPGNPPNMTDLPPGDPFAPRNEFARKIDFQKEPPLFEIPEDENHFAATWMIHPLHPKFNIPEIVKTKIKLFRSTFKNEK